MYAEIKDNNRIMINRCNDSERILLKNIFDESQANNKVVKLTPLTDETGDFGGVFLTVEDTTPNIEEVETAE